MHFLCGRKNKKISLFKDLKVYSQSRDRGNQLNFVQIFKEGGQAKAMKKIFLILLSTLWLVFFLTSCSKASGPERAESGEKTEISRQDKSNASILSMKGKTNIASREKETKGEKEYVSERYGFSFRYNLLMLNDKPSGNDILELKHLSGDRAVLTIRKPEAWEKNPEDYFKTAYKDTGEKIYTRKEFKLGKCPALLVEFSRTIMKMRMRIIELTAFKDGYFYSLIITMDENYVDDVRKEFDLVVNSFRLLDTRVDLESRWKDQLPADFPHDVLPLYGVDEIYYVSGNSLTREGRLTVVYDSKESRENLLSYYADVMKDAAGLVKSTYYLAGTKSGYPIEITLEWSEILKRCRVTIRISARK